ncbi:MAG: DMT family transporter [Eubacterium sp.]
MVIGLSAGILWALDTVILGVALAMSPFVTNTQAIFLAPFVSTFLHDFFSSIWMLLYTGVTKQFKNVIRALKTRSGKFILLAALLGGPIGMSGYVAAIHYIGPAYTAIISAMYPALGAFLSFIFLKEKMKPIQIAGLCASILGVVALGYQPGDSRPENFLIGFFCALLCCVGWASEGVICAYGMKDPQVSNSHALQLRQLTSALFYGIIILPILGGWNFTASAIPTKATGLIVLAALFGTASYLCYYKALRKLGVSKAMPLNITYSAWSIVFSLLILHTVPDLKSIICGIIIVAGSLIAASEKKIKAE